MDAIELLVSQHHTLEALIKTVLAWPEPKVCRERLAKVADALALHLVAEESVFYPVLQKDDRVVYDHAGALEEHRCMKVLVADLLVTSPLVPAFAAKLQLLKESLEQHHLDEETRLFPRLRQLISVPQRNELGARLEQLQVQLLRQGSPRQAVALHHGGPHLPAV
jgi:hemerythrin superfamily protein